MIYTKENQDKGAELMRALVEKAWESAEFKEQLVKNPLRTIKEFTNNSFTIPENKKLLVEDQTNESIIYLNIPAKLNLDEMELTDDQLEMVAGGDIIAACAIVTVIGMFAGGGYLLGKDLAQ
ncbi:putative ribosomally synthesized peptide [Flavobacterium limicola]|uniref:Putative ribosomally synthesized peptide n=1 Tax=Flavobacterium limicola TaxID=180441 RepID=A0A495S6A8_9FLAO|nr:TOMM propeptide domain-containing protein [Flavobacterium limicola]RKS95387.1 putative ribosomally synthesized peptide [Flavobacterium limicola]